MARWVSDRPASSARDTSDLHQVELALVLGQLVVEAVRHATGPARRRARERPLRYRPVSQPPASGLHGITPMPYFWQVGSTEVSMPRTKIEYGGCSHRNRSRPRRSATHCASTICSAG